jgi:hypothetical protein
MDTLGAFLVAVACMLGYVLYQWPFNDIEAAIKRHTDVLRDIHTELKRMNDLTERYNENKKPQIDPGFTPSSCVTDALSNPLSKEK